MALSLVTLACRTEALQQAADSAVGRAIDLDSLKSATAGSPLELSMSATTRTQLAALYASSISPMGPLARGANGGRPALHGRRHAAALRRSACRTAARLGTTAAARGAACCLRASSPSAARPPKPGSSTDGTAPRNIHYARRPGCLASRIGATAATGGRRFDVPSPELGADYLADPWHAFGGEWPGLLFR